MKRDSPDDDDSFRPIESGGSTSDFDKVCKYFWGRFYGKKLLTFEVVPPTARGQLKNLMRNRFPNANSMSDVPDGKHRAFDVINNCTVYNKVFYLTQRIVFTFSLTPEEAKNFAEATYSESELIDMLMTNTEFPFKKTVFPLYDSKQVTDVEYGPYVVQTVLTYFNTHDKAVLDMGDKEKCYKLLDAHVGRGVDKLEFFTDHPPVPVCWHPPAFRELYSFYQEPVPDFKIIKYLDGGVDSLEPLDEVKPGRVVHLKTLPNDGKKCCFVFVEATELQLIKHGINTNVDDIKTIKSCKRPTWVFVFRNNTSIKKYRTLKHTLDDRVTRLQSLMIYIKEKNKNAKEFFSYVMPYNQ